MTSKLPKNGIGIVTTLSAILLISQDSPGAIFEFNIANAGESSGKPADDGQTFQQQWGTAANWTLVSGEDDGDNGYPDGTDTAIINRTALVNNSTRLTEESSPASLVSVAKITGTGTGNQDIVLKLRAFTFGDIESLESPDPFHIRAERDRTITITGVISGPGGLRLSRSGGFSNGVTEDELIIITGDAPNTITGPIDLLNTNGNVEPSYWVADKVGAFGQASTITLASTNANSTGVASLQITPNAVGGEGAIDDDATTLLIGRNGVLNLDSGVTEIIGEGLLQLDLDATGTFTPIPNGTYTNTEDWITGEGTIVVGAPSVDLAITDISYTTDAEGTTVSLTWNSTPGRLYAVRYSTDLENWDFDLDDGVSADNGDTTTFEFGLAEFPELVGVDKVFFRIEEIIAVAQ